MNEVFEDMDKIYENWIRKVKKDAPHEGYKWEIPIDSYRYKFEAGKYTLDFFVLNLTNPSRGYRRINGYDKLHTEPVHLMKNLKQLMVETEEIFMAYRPNQHSIKTKELIDRIGPINPGNEIWEFETDIEVISFENVSEPIFAIYENRDSLEAKTELTFGEIVSLEQDSLLVQHLDAMLEYAKVAQKQSIPADLVDDSITNICRHFIQSAKECTPTMIVGITVRFNGNGVTIGQKVNIGYPYTSGRTARVDRFLIENEEQIIAYIKECRTKRKPRVKCNAAQRDKEARDLTRAFAGMLRSTIKTKRIDKVTITHDERKYVFTRDFNKYDAAFSIAKDNYNIRIPWPFKCDGDDSGVGAFIDEWPVISQLFKEEIERIVGEAKAEEDDLANTLKSDFMTELMLMKMGGAE